MEIVIATWSPLMSVNSPAPTHDEVEHDTAFAAACGAALCSPMAKLTGCALDQVAPPSLDATVIAS
jgi:hypothetical protein